MKTKAYTQNKLVATTPFPTRSTEQTVLRGGLIGVKQKVTLTELTVVLASEDGRYQPGMKVFVRGDLAVQDSNGNIHEIDGKSFILINEAQIQLVVAPENAPT